MLIVRPKCILVLSNYLPFERGKNIKEKFLKIIEEFDDAGGGGHDDAIGLQMNTKDLDPFHDKLKAVINKKKP